MKAGARHLSPLDALAWSRSIGFVAPCRVFLAQLNLCCSFPMPCTGTIFGERTPHSSRHPFPLNVALVASTTSELDKATTSQQTITTCAGNGCSSAMCLFQHRSAPVPVRIGRRTALCGGGGARLVAREEVREDGYQCVSGRVAARGAAFRIERHHVFFFSTKNPGQKPFSFNIGEGSVIKGNLIS